MDDVVSFKPAVSEMRSLEVSGSDLWDGSDLWSALRFGEGYDEGAFWERRRQSEG